MTDAGSSLDMDDRRELAERVGTDLSRKEQETGLNWFNADERFVITSYSGTIVRSLLKHSEATIRWLYVTGAADDTGRVKDPSKLLGEHGIDIEGIRATLPVGSLSIKGTVRSSNKDSAVITTPESIENLGEAFTDGGTYKLPAVGDRARDREDGDEMIVLDVHPDERAGDRSIAELGGLTVAEVNQEYDPDAPTVEAVYADEAEAVLDGWRSVEDLTDAVEFGAISAYLFPADRLSASAGSGGKHGEV